MDKYSSYPNYTPLSKMTKKTNNPQWLVVHCSASDYDNFDSIQRYHITDSAHLWENVGYHYVIERGGKLVAGRPENYHGAHVAESDTDGVRMNNKSIGICLCGDLDKHLPDDGQVATLRKLLKELSAKYNIPKSKIKPHRYWTKAKTCFGSKMKDDWASSLLDEAVTPVTPPVPTPKPEPTKDCTAEVKEAVTKERNSIIDSFMEFITKLRRS